MFSQTLGTALGDWAADDAGLGYLGGVAVFGGDLIVVACLHFFTKISKTLLFWAAFILTRPLGAMSGDLFGKPVAQGGMAISRYMASGVPAMAIVVCILIFLQRAAVGRGHSTSDHLDVRGGRVGGLGSQVTESVTQSVTESGPRSKTTPYPALTVRDPSRRTDRRSCD
jgi:hypothetical protein